MDSLYTAFKSLVTYKTNDPGQSLDDIFVKYELPETAAEFVSMISVETDLVKRIVLYKRFIKFVNSLENSDQSVDPLADQSVIAFFGRDVSDVVDMRDFLSKRLVVAYRLLSVASKPWDQDIGTSRQPVTLSVANDDISAADVSKELLAGVNFGSFNIQVHVGDTREDALLRADSLHITHNTSTHVDVCVVLARDDSTTHEEQVVVGDEIVDKNIQWQTFVVTNMGVSFKIDDKFGSLYRDIRDKHVRYDVDCLVTFLVYRIGQPGFLPLSHAMNDFVPVKPVADRHREQYEQLYYHYTPTQGVSSVIMMSPLKSSTFTPNTLHGQVRMVPMNLSLFGKFETLLLNVHRKVRSKYVSISKQQQHQWSIEYREALIHDIEMIPELMISESTRVNSITTLQSDIDIINS